MKKYIIASSIFLLLIFIVPLLNILFINPDTALIIYLVLTNFINPIISFLAGIFSGSDCKKNWGIAVLPSIIFLIFSIIFINESISIIAIYSSIYLFIGLVTMFIFNLILKKYAKKYNNQQ